MTAFGRFEILLSLAKTGASEVFLVRDGWMGQQGRARVLKLLEPHLEADKGVREEFLSRARQAMSLRHHRIPATIEAGELDGRSYVLQELVLGASLEQLLRASWKQGRALSVATVLWIASGVLEALVHAAPLVHRSISARTIVVGWDGVTRLTAFFSGSMIHGLLSPEQVQGKALDPRSDLWSLGVVLWEALAAKPLFTGDSMMQTLIGIMTKDLVPPSQASPGLPDDADELVMRALQRDPARRWRTAEEMHHALERVLRLGGAGAIDDARVQEDVLALMGTTARAQVEALKRAMLGGGTDALARAFGGTAPDPWEDALPQFEDTRT